MEVDFICGAKQAFETAVTAIFNNQKIRAESDEENKEISDNNNNNLTGGYRSRLFLQLSFCRILHHYCTSLFCIVFKFNLSFPLFFSCFLHISELFDTKLARFYENAIDLSYKLNHKVFHKVEMVRTPTIVNYDILYGMIFLNINEIVLPLKFTT